MIRRAFDFDSHYMHHDTLMTLTLSPHDTLMTLTLSPHLQVKLDWLREQIEFRTRGLQWVEFKTKWGSKLDDEVGTIPELTAHLKVILQTESKRRAKGELPDSAPAPVFRRKTFKELGTPTTQACAT